MDQQLPDEAIEAAIGNSGGSLTASFLHCMLRLLLAALPADMASPEVAEAARTLFFDMQPRSAMEAAACMRSVAAHFASMQMYVRAGRPGLSEDTALRLTANANACSRTADAALRTVRRPPPVPAASAAPPEPPVEQKPLRIPPIEQFQPRDRFGQPIHRGRAELMTMAQRRATYASPRNPEYEAEALADEAAMIAEQQALEAAQPAAAAAE